MNNVCTYSIKDEKKWITEMKLRLQQIYLFIKQYQKCVCVWEWDKNKFIEYDFFKGEYIFLNQIKN